MYTVFLIDTRDIVSHYTSLVVRDESNTQLVLGTHKWWWGEGQMNVILLARNRQFAGARIQQQLDRNIDWLVVNQNIFQISVCQSTQVSKRPTKVPSLYMNHATCSCGEYSIKAALNGTCI